MTFSELLLGAIRKSEIPLRFEPGAEEAVAAPVMELLRAWVAAHDGPDHGRRTVVAELLAELEGTRDVPV